jgi:hypothetical protein
MLAVAGAAKAPTRINNRFNLNRLTSQIDPEQIEPSQNRPQNFNLNFIT